MIQNEVHHRGYIARTFGKHSMVILKEDSRVELLHTGSYSGEGTDEDLEDCIDSYIAMRPWLDALANSNDEDDNDDDI